MLIHPACHVSAFLHNYEYAASRIGRSVISMEVNSRMSGESSNEQFLHAAIQDVEEYVKIWLSKRLRHRASEAENERDRDFRGVITILWWIQTELECFHSLQNFVHEFVQDIANDSFTIFCNEALGELLLQSKSILMTGLEHTVAPLSNIVERSNNNVIVMEHILSGIASEEIAKRFRSVAHQIRMTADLISEHENG